jgi:thiol-disulfide isomerase/thioredoxin
MASNLIDVTSPEHFQEILSKDLKRVSCLNFWAPWAEPCEAFNKDIEAAAGRYPTILFLNVSICFLSLTYTRCPTLRDDHAIRRETLLTHASLYFTDLHFVMTINFVIHRLRPSLFRISQSPSILRQSHQF